MSLHRAALMAAAIVFCLAAKLGYAQGLGGAPLGACALTAGTMNLTVHAPRSTGISPLLVFFDATDTTDGMLAGNTTPFQDVTYSWNFGDGGASGTGTWNYGSRAGRNSRNTATGSGIASHLFVTQGVDTTYTVTVSASDGHNTASCQLSVTAFDPAGNNGYVGNKTTCVSASGTPVPGSGDCPAGAGALQTSNFNSALSPAYFGSGRRVLFKCGDSFSGAAALLNGTNWSIGAFGGCEGTAVNRPILTSQVGELVVDSSSGDGRISDLDLEGTGNADYAVTTPANIVTIPYQITLSNLYSGGNDSAFSYSQGAQWGIVDSVMSGMGASIGTFLNFNENNPLTWLGNPFNNVDYSALLGNNFNGIGAVDNIGGVEVVRVSACRKCVFSNNNFINGNNIGATFKMHNGNTNGSLPIWTGVYTEFIEISDNRFGGKSGGQILENAPQNGGDDERLRNIVFERNFVTGTTVGPGGRQMMVSAVNETLRDNVFYMPGSSAAYAAFAAQIAARGIEPAPQGIEAYNNTCFAPSGIGGQTCLDVDSTGGMSTPAGNSYLFNNMFYTPVAGQVTVRNLGSNNAVSANSAAPDQSPGFVNTTGAFLMLSDFQPTANYAGGIGVPVQFDALGSAWSPSWSLGAIHP